MKINKKQLKCNVLVHKRLLALSMSAFCTGLVLSSVVQASDIDIYQQAKSGDITLMFVLDTSGSMGYPQIQNDNTACDIPSDATKTGYSKTTNSNNGVAEYRRYYCTANAKLYFFKRTGNNNSNYKYYSCGDDGSVYTGGCEQELTSVPSLTGYLTNGSNPIYYYKTVSNMQFPDRITRLKDGMIDLLNGNVSKNIMRVSDEKVIGLTTYSRPTSYDNTGIPNKADGYRGVVQIPARRLDCVDGKANCTGMGAYGTKTQRQILIEAIAQLGANSGTPTAHAYAEGAAALMGTTTRNTTYSGFEYAGYGATSGNNYVTPQSVVDAKAELEKGLGKQCSGQGVYVLTDGEPNSNGNAFGLMRQALAGKSFSCSNSDSGWDCTNKFSQSLLNGSNNPTGLIIKTAVVGFGGSFNQLPSYNKKLSLQQNLDNVDNATISGVTPTVAGHIRNAAKWGINSEGGWYSGNSSEDIVNSVNSFLGELNTGIPSVTTGAPTVPKDSLNPSVLLSNAFYPQFQPTPDKDFQLWTGNLKKYKVVGGVLKDKNDKNIIDAKGKLVDNYDYWAKAVVDSVKDADENTVGSTKFALMGGVKSQLELRTTADTVNRKLITNRIISGAGSSAVFVNGAILRQVQVDDLNTDYKYDTNRGYLFSLLGYNVDAAHPDTITKSTLATATELRQVGAVMHSSPILITNKGKITYTNYQLGSSNRENYVLFGTTQGLLHVVDAETGKEKFAFVPNEMVVNQKNAFLDYTKTETTSGLSKLYYGVDGPWTSYTEYVVDSDDNLTVGQGRGTQKGKQFVYGGLRMGGRSYYALDLSNIDTPKLQFQISPADQKIYYNGSSNSIEALKYMGQSWSKPTIAWVNWGKKRKRVMFVGGGYDAGGVDGDAHNTAGVKEAYSGYESDTYNQISKIGGGVYMFDADNGKLLWWGSANATAEKGAETFTNTPDLKYSVVSAIRTEDRDNDGLVDHLYFGDLGGQVFRIDLDNNTGSSTTLVKTPRLLLNLNSSTVGTSPRFYEMPAFSTYRDSGKMFAVVSIGSGNRSAPLKDYTNGATGYDYDAVYNIYDKDVAANTLFTDKNYVYQTTTSKLVNLNEITQAKRLDDTTIVAPFTTNGWYYRFKSNKLQSAKVFATPVVLNYRMFVSVFDGSKDGISGDCGAGVKGESFLNQFCMPYGQCDKSTILECTTGDGCSIGPGVQVSEPVSCDPNKEVCAVCDPAKEKCDDEKGNPDPKPDDGSNNKNYCLFTGYRGLTIQGGTVPAGRSKMCLIPQRWYELSR